MIFLRLFFEFFKAGLFAVGGGMATIPFLYDMSDNTGWFTYEELDVMIAVSESTPGPIGVNMATYVGYLTGFDVGGIPTAILGAITAMFGLITPSIIVILIISAFLASFRKNVYVDRAFYGLRPTSAGMIAAAGLTVLMSALFHVETLERGLGLGFFNFPAILLAVVLYVCTNHVPKLKKLHPIVFIGASAIVGILFKMG